MKTSIVCALAFVVLVYGEDGIQRHDGNFRVCEPRATKMDDCNRCFCTEDGSGWACTRKLCLPPELEPTDSFHRAKREITCEPNTNFMMECNHCYCAADGRSAACTVMGCLGPSEPHTR